MTAARLLVIDDSTTLRKLVEIAMRGTGVDIDFAATGSDGISRARQLRPDVILLDYVLPDLQSTDVCQQLSDDNITARVPIVVMSANQASIFESFRKFPTVVDFVGKPFTPTEIRTRLESAIRSGSVADPMRANARPSQPMMAVQPPAEAGPLLNAIEVDLARRALVRVLAPELAKLDTLKTPADVDPVTFYANYLLGDEMVSKIVAACAGSTPGASTKPQSGELQLRGDLMATQLLEVLRLLTSSTATGTLTIELADTFRIHLRRGEILMCTTSRFDAQSLGSVPLSSIAPETVQRARRIQLTEGKPAMVTLAQVGAVRVTDLPAELHSLGGRLLGELLGATAGRFVWQSAVTLPDYVDAFGRHLSITSIALERQRSNTSEHPSLFLDEICDRTPRFSEKLAGARLNPDEQRLLGMIDGRLSVREIVRRAGLSNDRAAAIFARLRNVDLIRSEGTSLVAELSGGTVAVVDTDQEFVTPLRAHLARRSQPLEVLSIDPGSEIASSILKLRPRLVLINAKLVTPELVARELAPIARVGTISIAAILDTQDPALVNEMLRAGVHAVLMKPIHINDLERLLSL